MKLNNSKKYASVKILIVNFVIVAIVVLINVYVRSLTVVNVEVTSSGKQVEVVKAYYDYFGYMTLASFAIVFIVWLTSVYLLISQRIQLEKRLYALTSQFEEIGISRLPRDNPLFTEDELLIIDTWNSNIDIIEKQVSDREKYLNSMIHDFKMPIQILKSNVQIYNLKHGENKYVNAIGQEILDLERDVLNYLVVEKINYFEKAELKEQALEDIFNQVIYRYRGLDFDVKVTYDTTNTHFRTDITMFMKIVDNVIENAMKHGQSKWLKLNVHDDRIEFINEVGDLVIDDIFDHDERHLSVNGNGLGVEIIKTYTNLLGYTIDSKVLDEMFIVTLYISKES